MTTNVASTTPRIWVRAATLVATALLAAAFGWSAHVLPASSWWILLVAALAVGPAVAVLRVIGPAGCLGGLLLMTFFGLYRQSFAVGPVDLRPTDAAYVLLVALIVFRPIPPRQRVTWDVGQRQLAALLGVFGLSLIPLIVHGDGGLSNVVSWLRFVQTVSLIWLVPYALADAPVRRRVPAVIVVGITAELLWAVFVPLLFQGGSGARLTGHNGPDAEGLLAAALVATVVIARFPSRGLLRWAIAILGLVALGLTRSLASIIALAVVLAFARPSVFSDLWRRHKSALSRPAQVLGVALAAAFLAMLLRPGDVPGSQAFNSSSTLSRVIHGAAGMHMFTHHPILGVGWQRSSGADVIGSPEMSAWLHARFPDARDDLFPAEGGSATVHNTYVQILAESGLVGGLATIVVFVVVVRRIRRIRRHANIADEDRPIFSAAAAIVLLTVIWWNDNPLFGAQPETVLAATALGLLACRWVPRTEPEADR